MKRNQTIFILVLACLSSIAQQKDIDSITQKKIENLYSKLHTTLDQDKSIIHSELGLIYSEGIFFNRDSSLFHYNKSLAFGEKYQKLKIIVDALDKMANQYVILGDSTKAFFYVRLLIKKANLMKDEDWINKGYSNMGRIYQRLEQNDSTIHYYKKAYQHSREQNLSAATNFYNALLLSSSYSNSGKFEKAIPLLKMNTVLAEDESIYYRHRVYYFTVFAYIRLIEGKYDKAIMYYQKSLDIGKNNQDNPSKIFPLIYLGRIHVLLNKPNEALPYFNQAYKVSEDIGLEDAQGEIYYNLGLVYKKLNKLSLAKDNFEKALVICEKIDDHLCKGYVLKELAEIYNILSSKPLKPILLESKNNLLVGIEKSKNNQDIIELMEGQHYLFKVDSLLGDIESSLKWYHNYISFRDSLFNIKNKILIQELELTHETNKKTQEVNLLKTQNELQILKAKESRVIRIVLLVLLIISSLFLVLLLNRYIIKQKSYKIIKFKNNEIEILMKEIHHRVKNNLQIILSLLNSQINRLKNEKETRDVFVECQNKIKSISIIHQKLYKNDNFNEIPASDFIKDIVEYLKRTYEDQNQNDGVKFMITVDEIMIKMETAVPIGLIINEIVTNSLKYAFSVQNYNIEKKISIKFQQIATPENYILEINDNGVGLPVNFDVDNLSSFGIQMIRGLVNQLDGKFEMNSALNSGTLTKIILSI